VSSYHQKQAITFQPQRRGEVPGIQGTVTNHNIVLRQRQSRDDQICERTNRKSDVDDRRSDKYGTAKDFPDFGELHEKSKKYLNQQDSHGEICAHEKKLSLFGK